VPRALPHIAFAALLSVAPLGCGHPTPAPPAKATPAANASQKPAIVSPVPANESKTADDKPEPPAPPEPPKPEPPRPERIAILTPGGPLLIDVRFTIDGHAHTQAIEAQLDQLLAAADTDADKRPTWNELFANDEFMKSPLANAANATGQQKYQWANQYDLNDNDLVERGEAAAWLGRDAGRSAKAFAVRSIRSTRPDPRATSRIWPLLDTDGDGKLSAVETRDASQSLLSLDANDDLTLSAQELLPLRDQLMAANGQNAYDRMNAEHFAALHLEENDDPARLEYVLNDLYAPRQDLTPESFPAFSELGEELDSNSDNWLDSDELAELLKVKPHLELTVAFGKPADAADTTTAAADKPARRSSGDQASSPLDATPATPNIHLDRHAPEVTIISASSPSRLLITVGGTPIALSAHDLAPQSVGEGAYTRSGADANQIRLLAHDQTDAVFAEIDANADARLSEREIKTVRDRLLSRDANQDRQLADEELPYSMIVAFIRGEAAGEQSFYVPASPPAATSGLAPPKWFTRADLNGDGEISRREFLGTPDHFSHADLSRDGYITPDEAAQTSTAP
jgi:hypothetical protein